MLTLSTIRHYQRKVSPFTPTLLFLRIWCVPIEKQLARYEVVDHHQGGCGDLRKIGLEPATAGEGYHDAIVKQQADDRQHDKDRKLAPTTHILLMREHIPHACEVVEDERDDEAARIAYEDAEPKAVMEQVHDPEVDDGRKYAYDPEFCQLCEKVFHDPPSVCLMSRDTIVAIVCAKCVQVLMCRQITPNRLSNVCDNDTHVFKPTAKEHMMAKYVLCAESTADYPRSYFEKRSIPYITYHYELDGVPRIDDLYTSTTPQMFFNALKAGSESTTSQPSAGEYVEFWRPFLASGCDILHVVLSSGITGAINSARVAQEQLQQEFPDRSIRIVDSLLASSGFGLLVDYLADLRDAGTPLDTVYRWAEEHKLDIHAWFFVSDLDCLKRGGRVSSTSAIIATALKICPVLNMDNRGRLIPRKKIRTVRKATSQLADMFFAHAQGGADYEGKCVVSHSNAFEEAKSLVRMIEFQVPALAGKIAIYDIGTVIGSHTGPGTVALFFMGDRRLD